MVCRHRLVLIMVWLFLALSVSPPLSADLILIDNASFENPALGDGITSGTSTPSWNRIGGATFLNPSSTHFIGGLASDGSNVATLSAAGSGQSLFQNLPSNTLQFGTYTFQFEVGDRLDQAFHNVDFDFLVNATTIISPTSAITPTVPDGEFRTWTYNYEVLNSNIFGGFIGDPIRIRFLAFGSSGGFSIDNVRGNFVAVPEPASLVLGFFSICLAGLRRNRRTGTR